jgi:hypothetical protein
MLRLALIIMLVACGHAERDDEPPQEFIDSRFTDIVDQYDADADKHYMPPHNTPKVIEYADLPPDLYAYCEERTYESEEFRGPAKYRVIVVNSSVVKEELLRVVLYHELSHCYYNAHHILVPGEIMAPNIKDEPGFWNNKWEEKVERMFKQIKEDKARGLNKDLCNGVSHVKV